MQKDEKKSLLSNIVAGVLSGLILLVLPTIWLFIPSLWQWITSQVTSIYTYVVSDILIPRYLFFLLLFISLISVVRLLLPLFKRSSNEPKLWMYTEDIFFNIVWRWKYPLTDVYYLKAFCPNCDTLVVYTEHGRYFEPKKTSYYCETCRRDIVMLDGDRDYVLSSVGRQVDRKIRLEEWRQVVASKIENPPNKRLK